MSHKLPEVRNIWVPNSENIEEERYLETPPAFLQLSEEAWRASFKTTRLKPVLQQGGLRVPSGFNLPKTSKWHDKQDGAPKHQIPTAILTADKFGTGKFQFDCLELLLQSQMDARWVHTVTLTWFIGKTCYQNSASWQMHFRGSRRQKTSEATPEQVLSLASFPGRWKILITLQDLWQNAVFWSVGSICPL